MVAMHTVWRRCASEGTHLYLYFGCNAHILEDMRAFRGSHYICILVAMHTYFGGDTQLSTIVHLFTEEMTLI